MNLANSALDQNIKRLTLTEQARALAEAQKLKTAEETIVGSLRDLGRQYRPADGSKGTITPKDITRKLQGLVDEFAEQGIPASVTQELIAKNEAVLTFGNSGIGPQKALDAAAAAKIAAENPYSQDATSHKEILKNVGDFAKANGFEGGHHHKVVQAVSTLLSDGGFTIGQRENGEPIKVPVTESVILQVIALAEDNNFWPTDNTANNVLRIARQLMDSPEIQRDLLAKHLSSRLVGNK